MSNNSLLQSYSANVIINCFRKMLLLKKIFDKRWPIAASNCTCQSQIMYANGLNSWNCRGFSGKSMSFEKQVKSFFHAFFFSFFWKKTFSEPFGEILFPEKRKTCKQALGIYRENRDIIPMFFCRFFFFLEKEFFILGGACLQVFLFSGKRIFHFAGKSLFLEKEKQKTHGKKILLVFPKLYFFQKNPPNSKKSMCSHTLSVIDRSNWILLLAIDYRKSFSSTTSFAKE